MTWILIKKKKIIYFPFVSLSVANEILLLSRKKLFNKKLDNDAKVLIFVEF